MLGRTASIRKEHPWKNWVWNYAVVLILTLQVKKNTTLHNRRRRILIIYFPLTIVLTIQLIPCCIELHSTLRVSATPSTRPSLKEARALESPNRPNVFFLLLNNKIASAKYWGCLSHYLASTAPNRRLLLVDCWTPRCYIYGHQLLPGRHYIYSRTARGSRWLWARCVPL